MNKKIIYVDIDDTICFYGKNDRLDNGAKDYLSAVPDKNNIKKINKLYDSGNFIKYWTSRGSKSGVDYYDLTKKQLDGWGVKYHDLSVGEKPFYDVLICDKTKRIEEV